MSIKNLSNSNQGSFHRALFITCACALAPIFLVPQPAVSQTDTQRPITLEEIKQIELEKIEQGAQAQIQIENLDEKRLTLAGEYRSALKQTSNLKKYNQQLRNTIISQEDDKQLLQQQIARVSHLERDIVPLMTDMLDALSSFIALDTPFLYEERMARVEKLKVLFNNGKISNSEKYRRILEAYQIENDYGRSIEAYDGSLQSSMSANSVSSKQAVTFLKVGRLAYLYQTKDKKQVFHWSTKNKQWKKLDSSYNAQVDEGIKMAREQIPSNLMFVPVEAPESI